MLQFLRQTQNDWSKGKMTNHWLHARHKPFFFAVFVFGMLSPKVFVSVPNETTEVIQRKTETNEWITCRCCCSIICFFDNRFRLISVQFLWNNWWCCCCSWRWWCSISCYRSNERWRRWWTNIKWFWLTFWSIRRCWFSKLSFMRCVDQWLMIRIEKKITLRRLMTSICFRFDRWWWIFIFTKTFWIR